MFTVPSAVVTPPTAEEKETDWIVAPAIGVAEAVTVVAVPTVADELFAGAVSATEVAVTAVTLTPEDVTELPFVSVTLAVIVKFPAAEGTHVSAKGADVSVPTTVAVPPEGVTKNCTWEIVAALPAAAVAVRPTLDPTVTTEPTPGAVMATVG